MSEEVKKIFLERDESIEINMDKVKLQSNEEDKVKDPAVFSLPSIK